MDVDATSDVRPVSAGANRQPMRGAAGNGWPTLAVFLIGGGAILVGLDWLPSAMGWLGVAAAFATLFGCATVALGAVSVQSFAGKRRSAPTTLPPVSVLRPLYGDEPALDSALATLAAQSYPAFQIVFGVKDADDPALLAVARLRAAHPALDVTVVKDPTPHGPNRKVSNLINMLPAARHDMLVFSDSDLHVAPDYLRSLMTALAAPSTGMVTALCTGLPTSAGVAARLGAMQITLSFLPGALLSRVLGRQDCLGTTMALHRATLARAGGLQALVGHLADDNLLGRHVRQLGLRIALASTVPATGVPESAFGALWQHELRWARTIRGVAPAAFAASALQFPIAWALLACICTAASGPSLALLGGAWLVRYAAAAAIGRSLAPAPGTRMGWRLALLLPVRDLISVAEIAASFTGRQVLWRGHVMRVDARRRSFAGSAVKKHAAPVVL